MKTFEDLRMKGWKARFVECAFLLFLVIVGNNLMAEGDDLLFQDRFICDVYPGYGWDDIGQISLYGDPVKNIYTEVTVANKLKAFRYGVTDRAYMYLYDDRVRGKRSYALEIVNYPISYDKFWLSVYPKSQIVVGSYKIARYTCEKD